MLRIANGLDEQADRGDPLVVEQRGDAVLDADDGLVADAIIMAPSRSPRCWKVRLTATLPLCETIATPRSKRAQTVLVGPQGNAIERVDVAVAVRPEERHVAGGGDQLCLQRRLAGLGEPGCRSTPRHRRRCAAARAIASMVAWRLTPRNTASGTSGQRVQRGETRRCRRARFASGAPARSRPGSRACRHWRTTRSAGAPPTTAIDRGASRRRRSVTDQAARMGAAWPAR